MASICHSICPPYISRRCHLADRYLYILDATVSPFNVFSPSLPVVPRTRSLIVAHSATVATEATRIAYSSPRHIRRIIASSPSSPSPLCLLQPTNFLAMQLISHLALSHGFIRRRLLSTRHRTSQQRKLQSYYEAHHNTSLPSPIT